MKNKRKLMELRNKHSELVAKADAALDAKDTATYESTMQDISALVAEIKTLEDLVAEETRYATPNGDEAAVTAAEDMTDKVETLKAGGKVALDSALVRGAVRDAMMSVVIGTDSLAKPTRVDTDIRNNHDMVSELLNRVSVEDLKGCESYEVPYVKVGMSAAATTDGQAATESTPTFRVAAIKPTLVTTVAYVSKRINNLTPVSYFAKVQELAVKALKEKVVEFMTKGDGSTFYGLYNATNTKSEAIYDTMEVTSTTIDAGFLRRLVLSCGGSNSIGEGILVLKKADLVAFGDVRGTNEKKPVFEIIPDSATHGNTGVIKDGGLSVNYILNDQLTALTGSTRGEAAVKTMVYVDLLSYMLGLFGDYSIEVSKDEKFSQGLLSILGEVMAGGNLVADKAATIVTLKAADPEGGDEDTQENEPLG